MINSHSTFGWIKTFIMVNKFGQLLETTRKTTLTNHHIVWPIIKHMLDLFKDYKIREATMKSELQTPRNEENFERKQTWQTYC